MEMKKFEPEKLKVGKFIAHGAFGAVYEGKYEGRKVAVKALNFGGNKEEEEIFKKEASLWSTLDHPNVAQFIGAAQIKLSKNLKMDSGKSGKKDVEKEKHYWCMVSEFLGGGTLCSYLEENKEKKLPLKEVIAIALDVARGLDYLHSQKVVHRDVKKSNLVMDRRGKVFKLIDFGLSRKEAENLWEMTGNTGTDGYMAPEVKKCGPYDHKCDVFSFGLVLYELFHCKVVEMMPMSTKPYIYNHCPPKLAHVINQCLLEVETRPEMAEVIANLEDIMSDVNREAEDQKKGTGCFSFLK